MVILGLGAVCVATELSRTGYAMVGTLGMLQTQEVVPIGNGHLVEVFIVIAALALLAQAAVIVALVLALLKVLKTVSAYAAEIRPKVIPIIDKTNDIVGQVKATAADLSPKISEITSRVVVVAGHATDISGMVKEKVTEFGPTVDKWKETIDTASDTARDATQKTHEQVLRLNQMVTESLEATAKAGQSFRHTVTAPGRSVAGAVNGVKAAVTSFFNSKKPKPATYRATYRSNPAPATPAMSKRFEQGPIDN